MKKLEIQDLQERIDEILHIIDEGETVELTNHGEVIARLIPANKQKQPVNRDIYAFWRKIDKLATQVGTHLPEKVDAVEIIREGRREL